MYQIIYDFILNDMIGAITAPTVGAFVPTTYVQLLSHGLTVVSMVLLYILCIKFIVWVSGLFGRVWR